MEGFTLRFPRPRMTVWDRGTGASNPPISMFKDTDVAALSMSDVRSRMDVKTVIIQDRRMSEEFFSELATHILPSMRNLEMLFINYIPITARVHKLCAALLRKNRNIHSIVIDRRMEEPEYNAISAYDILVADRRDPVAEAFYVRELRRRDHSHAFGVISLYGKTNSRPFFEKKAKEVIPSMLEHCHDALERKLETPTVAVCRAENPHNF